MIDLFRIDYIFACLINENKIRSNAKCMSRDKEETMAEIGPNYELKY